MIRIITADDHLIVREGLRLIIETTEDMEITGEATNGAEAIDLVNELKPDVVLMDMRMSVMDGLTAIQHIMNQQPDTAVVILTTFNEDELMIKGLQAGAKAFLLKDTDRATLLDTIRSAARGETLLKPEIMARLMAFTQSHSPAEEINTSLTERELEILLAVAQGERNKEIAFRLGISERTVKAHLTSIFNKLGVDSRTAAVAVASQQGLV